MLQVPTQILRSSVSRLGTLDKPEPYLSFGPYLPGTQRGTHAPAVGARFLNSESGHKGGFFVVMLYMNPLLSSEEVSVPSMPCAIQL